MKYLSLLLLSFLTACALPAVDKIDLASCTNQCNETSKVCFDIANKAADACLLPDASSYERTTCVQYQTKEGEKCINTLVSCVSDCIEETQKQLGGK